MEHLTWSHHIINISKKLSRGIGIIAKLRCCMESKLLKNIYYSLVYSHLTYGIQVWGSACSTLTEKLLILQKKAVRILSGCQYFQIYGAPAGPLPASEPLFRKLEILKLDDIFKLHIAKFIFSCLARKTPNLFFDWFTINYSLHSHSTTSSTVIVQNSYFDVGNAVYTNTLHTKGSNLSVYGAKQIKVMGPILWNNLPTKIRESNTLSSFKYHLKKYMIEQYTE